MALGKCLESHGNPVQFFGMDHSERCLGNTVNAYSDNMDFHSRGRLNKISYPVRTIYNAKSRKKIRQVLDDFQPDAVHLNNFSYQLTPSIILEIDRWRKETGKKCRIVYTAHDYNLICPNHMLYNVEQHRCCESCLGGHFANCTKNRCIHGSLARSMVGSAEAFFWNGYGVYRLIDSVICCSQFMKSKMDSNPFFKDKTVVMHNFVEEIEEQETAVTEKKDYILYFGRFSEEKGILTLLNVCRELPGIPFVFAGSGPLETRINGAGENVINVGFLRGEQLRKMIREARFSVCPSEWNENCPMSVLESQALGTPVVGAEIGGIPELIREGKTGELFRAGDAADLKKTIEVLWNDREKTLSYSKTCREQENDTVEQYMNKLMEIYKG